MDSVEPDVIYILVNTVCSTGTYSLFAVIILITKGNDMEGRVTAVTVESTPEYTSSYGSDRWRYFKKLF